MITFNTVIFFDCDKMETNIFDASKIWNDSDRTIEFLQDKGVLKRNIRCCDRDMTLVKSHCKDGKEFKCYICDRRFSVRTGSFLYKSRLSLSVLLALIYFFCVGLSVSKCCKMLKGKASKPTVIQWFIYLREICSCTC